VFRTGQYWSGSVHDVPSHEITRNKLRAADAWMDGYAALVHRQSPPLVAEANNSVGDLSQLLAIRHKFQCKPFQWYLDNV
jgi:polypeptide N-acetylgalactosaminyltransferase